MAKSLHNRLQTQTLNDADLARTSAIRSAKTPNSKWRTRAIARSKSRRVLCTDPCYTSI